MININTNKPKFTEEQYKIFEIKTSLGLIDALYKRKLINENTYKNICKKYKSYL